MLCVNPHGKFWYFGHCYKNHGIRPLTIFYRPVKQTHFFLFCQHNNPLLCLCQSAQACFFICDSFLTVILSSLMPPFSSLFYLVLVKATTSCEVPRTSLPLPRLWFSNSGVFLLFGFNNVACQQIGELQIDVNKHFSQTTSSIITSISYIIIKNLCRLLLPPLFASAFTLG